MGLNIVVRPEILQIVVAEAPLWHGFSPLSKILKESLWIGATEQHVSQ